jgi:hypothetical protein
MKKIYMYLGVACLALMSAGLTGCYKDVISPETDPDGPPQSVSFSLDVAPMLEAKCATAGCHVSGAKKPYLTKDASYGTLANGGYVNTIVPKESILYKAVFGSMTEYIPSPKDKSKVYDWIRNGAPNN